MALIEKLAILVKNATLDSMLSFERGDTEILSLSSAGDFTPNMTGYSAPSPNVVTASGEYGYPYYAWKSFDGSLAIYNSGIAPISDGYCWWKFDLGTGNAKTCESYKLIYADFNEVGDGGCAPKDWKLQGSNDNSTWDDLDTVTGETNWGSLEARAYQCDVATTAYRYFRLYVSTINGGPYGCALKEIELYLPTLPSAILPETDSGDNSTVWDMSTIANRENLGSQTGNIKYQYSCHGSTGNPSWNGTWLTLSELQAVSDPTGRYFQLNIQFADGISSFQDSYIEAAIPGSVADYPDEADVLEGVTFDSGNKIGTLKKYSVTTSSSDTLRQRIIDTIDTRLKTITIANGYQTNLGNNIFEWRITPLDPDTEMPGAIYEDIQDTIALTTGLHLHTLELEIGIFAKGSASPSDMRKLIGDIHEMIGTDVTWGGLAEDTKIESEEITATQVSELIINVKTKINIEFTTKVFDPFS